MRRALPVLALMLLAGSPSVAQEPFRASAFLEQDADAPQPPRTAGNAAWAYYKAWDTITTMEDRTRFGELLAGLAEGQKKLTKEQRECLSQHQAYVDGVLAATAMETCDWGSRTDKGFMALLPHLGFMRQSARTLGMDARRCAEDGNSTGAAERVVALLRLADHASTDHFLISALVGTAITGLAMNLTEDLLRDHQITPAAARMILAAIKKVDRTDPWHAFSAIDLERKITLDTFRRDWTGPDAAVRFVRTLSELGSLRGDGRAPKFLDWYLLSFTEQRIQAEVDRADRYYDAVKAAWPKPGAAVALDELETEAGELQWGFVAHVTGAAFAATRRSTDRTFRQMDAVAGKLRAIIEQNDGGAPQ